MPDIQLLRSEGYAHCRKPSNFPGAVPGCGRRCGHAATSGVVSSSLCLARQWIHVLRQLGVYVQMETPVLESILVLLLAPLNGEVCAADASVALRGFLVSLDPVVDFVLLSVVVNDAVRTADASVASARGYLDTVSTSSLYLVVTFAMTGLSCPSWCNNKGYGPDSAENCLEGLCCCEYAATSSTSPQV